MNGTHPACGEDGWFTQSRFGMFIHWGLYALPARHEWVRKREQIPLETYETYFRHFDPDLYDPAQWAAVARAAGMKYFCITTKHHEGFCLWDSKLTDYKAPNTPAGRDLLRPMIEAFRREGLRVGLYHSLIDWHHPQFVIDDVHVLHNHPDRKKLNEGRDQKKYAEYLHGQVRELLTQYGPVDLLFFDFSYPAGQHGRPADYAGKGRADWASEQLIKLVRQLQPNILVNDRLDLMDVPGGWDYRTPEQFVPEQGITENGRPVPWEVCHTFSGSWGYHRDESTWKSVEQLLMILIDCVSKGGNLLLNVGPTARGEFDGRALDRLAGMGEWMKRHGRSIYGCGMAPPGFTTPRDCRLTYNPKTRRLYVHFFAWPAGFLCLPGMAGKVAYAQLLNDASEIRMSTATPGAHMADEMKEVLVLYLPVTKPNAAIPVVELFLK